MSNNSNHQFYAQRLNNSAALCIEIGYYDRAIQSLQKALKLCEYEHEHEHNNNNNNNNSSNCSNSNNSIEPPASCSVSSSSSSSERTAAAATTTATTRTTTATRTTTLDECIAFSETYSLDSTILSHRNNFTSTSTSSFTNSTRNRDDTVVDSHLDSDSSTRSRSAKRQRRPGLALDVDVDVVATNNEESAVSSTASTTTPTSTTSTSTSPAPAPAPVSSSSSPSPSPSPLFHHPLSSLSSSLDSYVYRTPIRIPKQRPGEQQQQQQQQQTGFRSVLYIVVVFNLALAHQLKALDLLKRLRQQRRHHIHRSSSSSSSSSSRSSFVEKKMAGVAAQSVHKARLLCELLLKYWSGLRNNNNNNNNTAVAVANAAAATESLRFRMLLSNNLSRLYRWSGDAYASKERSCLEDLLSAVLVAQTQTRARRTRMETILQTRTLTTRAVRNNHNHHTHHHNNNHNNCCGEPDLDGFLSNTATLAMDHQAAGAA